MNPFSPQKYHIQIQSDSISYINPFDQQQSTNKQLTLEQQINQIKISIITQQLKNQHLKQQNHQLTNNLKLCNFYQNQQQNQNQWKKMYQQIHKINQQKIKYLQSLLRHQNKQDHELDIKTISLRQSLQHKNTIRRKTQPKFCHTQKINTLVLLSEQKAPFNMSFKQNNFNTTINKSTFRLSNNLKYI